MNMFIYKYIKHKSLITSYVLTDMGETILSKYESCFDVQLNENDI